MFATIRSVFGQIFPGQHANGIRTPVADQGQRLQAVGINDFLNIDVPRREMLLSPILPERSLAMLYAPRGIGKSWLSLSVGMAVAAGTTLLRWSAPRQRNVLYVDGEMPLVSLQERLRAIATGFGVDLPNEGFRLLAADNVERGINLSANEGQKSLEPLLKNINLLILDNLSTLTAAGESTGDAWIPMQNWLLNLRRRGISVLLVHHAGTNGRQRGTSRREDTLDTVIALRRPADYSLDQGVRFEIHFEKLRNRVDGIGASPFEAKIQAVETETVCWSSSDLKPPLLGQAAELFLEGMTVRQVAAMLRISKSEAGRLRIRALEDGLLAGEATHPDNQITVQ